MIPKTKPLQKYKKLQVVFYGLECVARPLLLFFSSEIDFCGLGSGYHQKGRKPSQNDKTEHGMEKTAKSRPKSKNVKVRVNTEESAVKPEPELKNTIECNLNPSDGPGKPNSIFMKPVKTKWALNQFQQPICVHLTKTVKTLKAQSTVKT
ncbi:hypothetical protein Tco_0153947 [Tanacetum coccineum]